MAVGRVVVAASVAAVALALGVAPVVGAAPGTPGAQSGESARVDRVEQRLEGIAGDPVALRRFFVDLPKGADLHQHLSGTVYAEPMLRWAAADGLCLTPGTWALSAPPCAAPNVAASSITTDPTTQGQIVAQWSMRLFRPAATQNGHDHFFATFGLFGWVYSDERTGDGLAEVLQQAARDHVVRVETKLTPNSAASAGLATLLAGQAPGAASDPARFPEALAVVRAGGLSDAVAGARAQTDSVVARATSDLGCATAAAQPGCTVDYAFVAQTNRNAVPERVFSSLAVAFATAAADGRWVAVDLVSPEDGLVALRDYALHMQMVRFLSTVYPGVHIDLHAGELVPSIVPPGDLTSHITQAVRVAGTDRVGHGVDIAGERAAPSLLREMRTRHIAVEIALTSNKQILEVGPAASQFPVYWRAGVPVVLATDDAGVERTDLSEQYALAQRWFHLTYADLKKLSYEGLRSAFVSAPQRARLTDRLDAAFDRFERTWGGG